jgi:hypothetical protein
MEIAHAARRARKRPGAEDSDRAGGLASRANDDTEDGRISIAALFAPIKKVFKRDNRFDLIFLGYRQNEPAKFTNCHCNIVKVSLHLMPHLLDHVAIRNALV